MIFQEPMTSLNPVLKIGLQIMEPLTIHLEHGRCGGARPGHRAPDPGRHHRPRKPAQPVSAPAVGRHAPAGDDRHRSCLQSQAADRRRADHRARRHHPGADPGADEGPVAPARRRRGHHHPQPRHRRALRRPRERHVCRAPGGERHRRARVRAGRCTPTRAACWRPCRGSIAAAAPSSPPSTARRPTCSTRRRAAASARAAASPSRSACEDPPLEAGEPGHLAACHRVAEIEALDPPLARAAATSQAGRRGPTTATPILDIRHAKKFFPVRMGFLRAPKLVRAVNDVTIDIKRGETLGLVGESGLRKVHPRPPGAAPRRSDGRRDPLRGRRHRRRSTASAMIAVRKKMQVIFQDPYSSLNPRMTVGQIIAEPIRVHEILPKAADPDRVAELLQVVGLFPYMALRYPHELSGGQRQRVGIARALAVEAARHRLRRGGLGARRVDPGPGHQPARGPAAEARPHLSLHRPRSGGGAAHLEQGRRHVSRPHRRVRAGRRAVRQSQAPLHAGAAGRRPGPRSRHRAHAAAHHHQGRAAEPAQPAQGLRVPSALPAGDGGMPQGRAGRRASLRLGIRWPAFTPDECAYHVSEIQRAETPRKATGKAA